MNVFLCEHFKNINSDQITLNECSGRTFVWNFARTFPVSWWFSMQILQWCHWCYFEYSAFYQCRSMLDFLHLNFKKFIKRSHYNAEMIYKMQFEWKTIKSWNICRKLCWIMKRLREMIEAVLLRTAEIIWLAFFLTFPARSTRAWRSAPPARRCLEIWLWYQQDISSENLKESRNETWMAEDSCFPPAEGARRGESLLFVSLNRAPARRRFDSKHTHDVVTATNLCNITHTHESGACNAGNEPDAVSH